jgi:hypothetical protein
VQSVFCKYFIVLNILFLFVFVLMQWKLFIHRFFIASGFGSSLPRSKAQPGIRAGLAEKRGEPLNFTLGVLLSR